MTLNIQTFLIVCPLVFLAGFIDAIGGGGGLISLPAYLIAGLPAHSAVATNKLSAAVGTVASTGRYIKNGHVDYKLGIPGLIMSLAGAQIGARLALMVGDEYFKIILMVILPVLALYMFFKKDIQPDTEGSIPFKKQLCIVMAASFAIGVYDGFYGPGTGTFLIIAYTALAKMDVLKAGGNTKLANLASNISSLVVFLMSGNVIISLGLVAAVFGVLGNYLGAGFAIKHGSKGIRYVILIVIALLFAKLLLNI